MTPPSTPGEADMIEQALLLQKDDKTEAACEILQGVLASNPGNSTAFRRMWQHRQAKQRS